MTDVALCAARRCTTATSPPGRGSCRSPAGRCRCSTRASARSTSRCGRHAGIFDVSHMGEVETSRAGRAARSCSACCPTTSRSSRRRRAVQRAVPRGRRRARRPLHLPARRGPLPDGHERVEPREGPRVAARACRRLRRRGRRPPRRLRDARDAGPARAGDRRRASPAAPLPAAIQVARRCRSQAHEALVCGTGYTGEDGVEILCSPDDARRRSGTRRAPPAPTPAGLAARDTLRLEVCFHLYGNDLMESRGPIEAGLGWCCKEDTGFVGARGGRARVREAGPAEQLVAVRAHRRRHPAPGQRRRRRRRGHERHDVALARHRDRHGLRAGRARRSPGRAIEIDVRGRVRAAVVAESRCTSPARRPAAAGRDRRRDRDGRRELPRRPALPPRARLGADRRRHRHVRHHLVRAGRARRGRLLRPAGRRQHGQRRRAPTPRSSRSRPSAT